jgi:hypothetical protein
MTDVPPLEQGVLFWHSCNALLTGTDDPPRFLSRLGNAIKNTGKITAAATSIRTTTKTAAKARLDMPQIFRRLPLELLVRSRLIWRAFHKSSAVALLGLAPLMVAGGGKFASIPPRDEPSDGRCRSGFSLSPTIQSIPSRLAVLPRSRFAASRVARRMRSGRLVSDARASASRTACTSRFGGLLVPALTAAKPPICLLSDMPPLSSLRSDPILPKPCPALKGSMNETSLVRRSLVCSEDEASSSTLSPSRILAT